MIITTKSIHVVDYNDFDKSVSDEYGHSFEIMADQESGNDQTLSFNVTAEIDKYDRAKVDAFRTTGRYRFLARHILNDMAAKGLIPTGEYSIRISW